MTPRASDLIDQQDIVRFDEFYRETRTAIDSHLETVLDEQAAEEELQQLMRHGISNGKRIRPMVTMTVAEVFETPRDAALNHAAIVEFIHNACVTGDTPVRRADGDVVPIREIGVGDEVVAFDPERARFEPRPVTYFHVNGESEVVDVELPDRTLTTTPDHEFLTVGDGPASGAVDRSTDDRSGTDGTRFEWVEAADLEPGTTLVAGPSEGPVAPEAQCTVDGGRPAATDGGLATEEVQAVTPRSEPCETFDIQVEGLHNYVAGGVVTHNTLVVDDYSDDDVTRRGVPTLWRVIERLPYVGPEELNPRTFTILTENGLLATALQLAREPAVVRAMGQSVNDTYRGFYKEGSTFLGKFVGGGYEDYIDINRHKTGGLFALATRMPAVATGIDDRTEEAIRAYGQRMGVLYQIADDTCDDDLPSFIDDPESELENWYESTTSTIDQFPVDGEHDRWLLETIPAWCVSKMLDQEGKTSVQPEFRPPPMELRDAEMLTEPELNADSVKPREVTDGGDQY
ncbi:hypothetical protein BRC81_09630 [Halobacteriales archaeon QS_1_68_20]|nr:MAG: hypothetical protein BRC81_09630 [Halobacteriales archaeon QS_1_68_20]